MHLTHKFYTFVMLTSQMPNFWLFTQLQTNYYITFNFHAVPLAIILYDCHKVASYMHQYKGCHVQGNLQLWSNSNSKSTVKASKNHHIKGQTFNSHEPIKNLKPIIKYNKVHGVILDYIPYLLIIFHLTLCMQLQLE